MSENEVVDYEQILAELAKKQAKLEKPVGANIGTRAGILTYNGDPVPENKLDVVVVASMFTNLYYEDGFDPDDPKNPVCYAYSETGENMMPHPSAWKPQADKCEDCPHNKWKSDPKGGRGKACKNTRSLAVIPANVLPDNVATCEMAVLKPPVTSVKAWQMYTQKCEMLYHRPTLGILTKIGTVPDVKSQFKLTFTDVGLVPVEAIKSVLDRVPQAKELLIKVYDKNDETPPEETKKSKKF